MKTVLIIVLLLVPLCAAFAQQSDSQMKMGQAEKPATLMSGLGSLNHPVSTTNVEARQCDAPPGHGYLGIEFRNINMDVDRAHEQAVADAVQASMVQREFETAWKNADVKLTVQDL